MPEFYMIIGLKIFFLIFWGTVFYAYALCTIIVELNEQCNQVLSASLFVGVWPTQNSWPPTSKTVAGVDYIWWTCTAMFCDCNNLDRLYRPRTDMTLTTDWPVWPHHYLRRRRLCFHFGLFVCLPVCLSVRRITEKVVNGFSRNFL